MCEKPSRQKWKNFKAFCQLACILSPEKVVHVFNKLTPTSKLVKNIKQVVQAIEKGTLNTHDSVITWEQITCTTTTVTVNIMAAQSLLRSTNTDTTTFIYNYTQTHVHTHTHILLVCVYIYIHAYILHIQFTTYKADRIPKYRHTHTYIHTSRFCIYIHPCLCLGMDLEMYASPHLVTL
jgi:hypothetical protein